MLGLSLIIAAGVFIAAGVGVLLLRSTSQLKLVETKVEQDQTFYTVRLEQHDFLFLKKKENVHFVQALDEIDDFEMDSTRGENSSKEEGELLTIPRHEKAS